MSTTASNPTSGNSRPSLKLTPQSTPDPSANKHVGFATPDPSAPPVSINSALKSPTASSTTTNNSGKKEKDATAAKDKARDLTALNTLANSVNTSAVALNKKKIVTANYANVWIKDEKSPCCSICKVNFHNNTWVRAKMIAAGSNSPVKGQQSGSTGPTEIPTAMPSSPTRNRNGNNQNSVNQQPIVSRHHCRRCGEVVCNLCSLFRIPYNNKKYQRTCLHCVLWFEIVNIAPEHLLHVTKEVQELLKELNLPDDKIQVQEMKNLIENLLHLTDREKTLLKMESLMAALDEEISNYVKKIGTKEVIAITGPGVGGALSNTPPPTKEVIISSTMTLTDFIPRYFLYPYLTKRYKLYLYYLQQDIVNYRLKKFVSYDAMVRGHIYPHSILTLRMFEAIVDNDLELFKSSVANGANLRHRLHLMSSNYSILDLKKNMMLLDTNGNTSSNSTNISGSNTGKQIDWRWINFYNVRDFFHHSNVVNFDAVSYIQGTYDQDTAAPGGSVATTTADNDKKKKGRFSFSNLFSSNSASPAGKPQRSPKPTKTSSKETIDAAFETDDEDEVYHEYDAEELQRSSMNGKVDRRVKTIADDDIYFRESVMHPDAALLEDIRAANEMSGLDGEDTDVDDFGTNADDDDTFSQGRPSITPGTVSGSEVLPAAPAAGAVEKDLRTRSRYKRMKSDRGNTPLHFAVACHNMDLVKELLTHDVMRKKVYYKNEESLSPVKIAQQLYPKMLDLFQQGSRRNKNNNEEDLMQILVNNAK